MIRFLIRRLIGTAAVLVAVSVLVFLIFFKTPGVDPARQMAGRNPNPETIAQIRKDFGLDKPLPEQYLTLMNRLVIKRDLISYSDRGRVLPRVVEAIPVTLSLVVGAAIIWVVFGIGMGLAAAVSRGTLLDPALMILGMIGISMPVFWLGNVVNLVTQERLHDSVFSWLPGLGYTPFSESPSTWFLHLLFPWLTLAISYIGLYGRVLRANLIEVESEDFVRTARAKGLTERRVLIRHSLRTSLISFVSLFGLDFGALAGGAALLTEQVFGLPGIGKLTYVSLTRFDLPVVMAIVMYGAFFVVFANLIVDLVYARLDPRIRPA